MIGAQPRVETAVADRVPPWAGGPLQIMIVAGSAGDARITAEMLRQHDPAVILTTCERVDEAARALSAAVPDCVLLDLGVPDADDLDGVSQIVAAAPGIPVVVLTGVDDDRLALAGVSRGAQDCVAKPELAAAHLSRTISLSIERARVTRELTHRVHHDGLTGLPNRALFERRVDQAIERAGSLGAGFSVMLVSVEDLKSLNDNFGHALGDEVLRESSRRLENGLESGDTAYRYAGAELAVICQSAEHPVGATSIAEWIRDSICRQPVVVGVRSLNIGVSIGVAIGSPDETTEALLHRLDGAIYEARLTGGGCVVD
ncbi:MAG: two-component system, cell cycle response regulator [Solirubrobacteraceae bacterium]|jgi:diguanylate cyclase (GGDEF)-like protein|nr:two-component system, cell cycle response regulator [Solirubrobacteraceae bacterium]